VRRLSPPHQNKEDLKMKRITRVDSWTEEYSNTVVYEVPDEFLRDFEETIGKKMLSDGKYNDEYLLKLTDTNYHEGHFIDRHLIVDADSSRNVSNENTTFTVEEDIEEELVTKSSVFRKVIKDLKDYYKNRKEQAK
jgi:hypothetical protein